MDCQKLLSGLGLDELKSWDEGPVLRRSPEAAQMAELVSVPDVQRLVTLGGLRYPVIRLVSSGKEIEPSRYTTFRSLGKSTLDGVLLPQKVFEIWRGGAVLALQSVQDYVPRVADACEAFASTVGHSVKANCYLAPENSNGLALHHDVHDNFVVQVAGRRRWTVFQAVVGRPVWGETPPFVRDRAAYETRVRANAPLIDQALRAGDLLFIPAGCPHEARTEGTASLHITFGVHRAQWRDLVIQIADKVASSSQFRTPLPPTCFDDAFRASAEEAVRQFLKGFERVNPMEIASNLYGYDNSLSQKVNLVGFSRSFEGQQIKGDGE
jgi:lysine-specific demethylase/histidyl-hydroxylase NO66